MKKVFVVLFLLLSLGSGTVVGLGVLLQYEARKNIQNIHLHPSALSTLKTSYDHLSKIDAFFPIGQTKDAGALLNPYIPLDGGGNKAHQSIWWNSLSKEETSDIKQHWLDTPERLSFPTDDLLTKLLDYDHWNLAGSGSYFALLQSPPSVPLAEYPIPNLSSLQPLAKVRLARGLANKNILPALREVRHLARLCQGQDSLVHSMVGVALLSFERSAYEAAVDEDLLTSEEWQPISRADTDLAKRMLFAAVSVFLSRDDGEAISEIQSLSVRRFNECATLNEAGSLLLSHHYLPNRRPLEVDLFPMIPSFEKAWADSGCELPALRKYWENPSVPISFLSEAEQTTINIPYIRVYMQSIMMGVGPSVPKADQPTPF